MITECSKIDTTKILSVINDAAIKYKGVIPDNCWHDPYMSEQELLNEFSNNLRMFGLYQNSNLIGVMGIQELRDVMLIRHAYTLTNYQGAGVGKSLLKYLLKINQKTQILVGTWKDAIWAIRFYEKFGFICHNKKQTAQLLKKYWEISSKQIENSVVLEKYTPL